MAQQFSHGDCDGYDDETAALILQLQLEDVDELLENTRAKGKGKEGVISHQELALQRQKEELEKNATTLLDRQMTKSIARAVLHDADQIAHVQQQELQAAEDRALALRLAGEAKPRAIRPRAVPSVISDNHDQDFLDKLSAIYHETPNEEDTYATVARRDEVDIPDQNGESSQWAATRKVARRTCVICNYQVVFYNLARLPCGDECCRDCLMEMFEGATVDESRYPPKCCELCNNISPETENVRLFLSEEVVKKYLEKQIEWETKNRTYCSNVECGMFIRAEHIRADVATCPSCNSGTCLMCKKGVHDGDCPEDEELQRTLELSKENKWRRCESCRRVIELNFGCNHITCHCKAQFCYLCGAKWKTCKCPLWDEDRLLLHAEAAAPRYGGLRNAVEAIRGQAGCPHGHFTRVNGVGRCAACGHLMNGFILKCDRCDLQSCVRCRRERY